MWGSGGKLVLMVEVVQLVAAQTRMLHIELFQC